MKYFSAHVLYSSSLTEWKRSVNDGKVVKVTMKIKNTDTA